MTDSEGVVKYELVHTPGPLPAEVDPAALFDAFVQCRGRGLIGHDPNRYDGAAYGNLSLRAPTGFVISATQTGARGALGPDDLAWVTAAEPGHDRIHATGPAHPSSEAMTHAEIYRSRPDVGAVIHVHSPTIWQHAAELDLPLTDPDAAYGTPAMAAAFARLLPDLPAGRPGLIVMGGHTDGVVAFGTDMAAALGRLLATLDHAVALDREAPGA